MTLKEYASVFSAAPRLSALTGIATTTNAVMAHGISLRQRHALTMLNLRGPADLAMRDAVQDICGCELPVAPNSSSTSPIGEILRLGPNEWLLVTKPTAGWADTMTIPGATLTDVSHARITVLVDGSSSRNMLAKGCAIDLHPQQFPAGTCIQTTIAKIGVILHKQQGPDQFALYAARSFAESFWHWMTSAAAEYGYHAILHQQNTD